MERDRRPPSSCRPSSGLIGLQTYLTNPIILLGPAWASLCGVVACDNFGWQRQDWLKLTLLILLVDGGWGTAWAALGGTDWATPLRRWLDWRTDEPVPFSRHTLSRSPGNRLSRWLGRLRAWWRGILWPASGPAISSIVIASGMTAALGALLGPELVLLSLAALAVMELNLVWEGGRGTIAPGWDAGVAVALPWLAGHVAFGPLTLRSAGLAALFASAWGSAWRAGSGWGRALYVGGQLLTTVLLVTSRRPLAAGMLLLLLVPQMALIPRLRRDQSIAQYVRYTRPWLLAAMLIAAWTL